MAGVAEWIEALSALTSTDVPRFVNENSGLPGPRANLPLVDAVAAVADAAVISSLIDDGSEFATTCAAAALAARADDPAHESAARTLATDDRWRVREGVAIGLQHLGDRAIESTVAIARRWADDGDPLVQRAAVAALCEPRLLRTSKAAAAAIDVCRTATERLAAMPDDQRRGPAARTLRQTLGYGWSVAIAADPIPGLAAFRALDVSHPDIAWIVAENSRKKRLSKLL